MNGESSRKRQAGVASGGGDGRWLGRKALTCLLSLPFCGGEKEHNDSGTSSVLHPPTRPSRSL